MTDKVPDLLVERLLAGDLPPEQAAAVRARLEAEPGGADRLEALRRSNDAIRAALPPDRVAREVHARAAMVATPRRNARWWVALPALAAAAAAVLVVTPPAPPTEVEVVRAKGTAGAKVFIHRQTADGHELLADGAPVHAGDVLQLGYASGGARHGVLLSVDSRGVVTLHQPPTPGGNTLLDGGGEIVLPRAYALDDAPGDETFLLITGDRPLDPFALRAAAQAGGVDAAFTARDGHPLDVARARVTKVSP